MSDFGEPPGSGEPIGNGLDRNGHTTAALTRLSERTSALERSLGTINEEIKHLPSKTTSMWFFSLLVGLIIAIATAYWNGIGGKFDGVAGQFTAVNAKIDEANSKLDALSKAVDRLQASPAPASSPTARRP